MRGCPRLVLGSFLLVVLGGCAASVPATSRQPDTRQIRCLGEREAGPQRPLFFLLCIQSP